MRKILFYFSILNSFMKGQVDYNHPEFDWFTPKQLTSKCIIMKKPKKQQENQQLWLRLFIILSLISIALSLRRKPILYFLIRMTIPMVQAYYYDNKIVIWASPLDFELRGSHRWLQNVITHEFAHIISLQNQ